MSRIRSRALWIVGLSISLPSLGIAHSMAATPTTPDPSVAVPETTVDGSDGGRQVTYSSTTFAVPFDVTLPEWALPNPTTEEPNFVTWEGSEVDRAIYFLAPISVYPPATMPSETPSPLPDEYLSYLLSQADYGATFDDVVETTIDGLPTTVVTATTDRSLDGSLGCQAEGLAAPDCYGLQPDFSVASRRGRGRRPAAVDLGARHRRRGRARHVRPDARLPALPSDDPDQRPTRQHSAEWQRGDGGNDHRISGAHRGSRRANRVHTCALRRGGRDLHGERGRQRRATRRDPRGERGLGGGCGPTMGSSCC